MSTFNDYTSRVALVTGAGKGIGAGIARALAAAGMQVAVNYTHGKDTADAVVTEISEAGGTAAAFQADISQEADVARLFAEIRGTFGAVDTLINNAGVWKFQPLLEVTVEEYHRHYDTNVLGNLLVSREYARQDDITEGVIVNLSTVGIEQAAPGTSLYTGTKMAAVAFTKVLAVELAPRNIRVNAIAPGLIDTEGTRASGFMGSDAQKQLVSSFPLARAGTPDDIGGVALFLVSPASSYMTGQVLFVDGGQAL